VGTEGFNAITFSDYFHERELFKRCRRSRGKKTNWSMFQTHLERMLANKMALMDAEEKWNM
jgi:hypothetical protein